MPFDGLKDKGERDDLLAYLKQATAPASAKQMLQTASPDRRRTADVVNREPAAPAESTRP
jgi:hypothetical protein